MKVIELTHKITENMPLYPGTEKPQLNPVATCEKNGYQETLRHFYSHTGTHMDAPAHLISEGMTLDSFEPQQFVGKGRVIDCRDCEHGSEIPYEKIEQVKEKADEADFLLFLTGWSKYWGQPEYFVDYPVISKKICGYITSSGKKGIGLDTISLDPIKGLTLPRHQAILSNNMVIIENLVNLERIGFELFNFIALPLRYENADGAPVRAIALI